MQRVGTIILSLMIVLWFLSSYPAAPPGATGPAIQYSYAGAVGRALEHVFAPIGFNWQISLALVPGLAAREVAVGALGTVYSLSATGDDVSATLAPMIAGTWSLATALSLLAWYVFAPQCLSTLVVVQARDQLLALSAHHDRIPLRAGVRGGLRDLPRGARAGRRLRSTSMIEEVAGVDDRARLPRPTRWSRSRAASARAATTAATAAWTNASATCGDRS